MRAMTRARLALAGFLIVVTMGCVSLPEQQAFNRAAHANIRDIGVLETQPTAVHVAMLNNPAASFGLIGGLVAAADQASKESRFKAIVDRTGFEPLAYFR